jgi:hypothetical protein
MNSTILTGSAAALGSLLGAGASIVTTWITLAANGKYRMDSRTTGPCSAIGKGQL